MDLTQISFEQFGAWGFSMSMSIIAIIALYRIYKEERNRNKEMTDKVLEAFQDNTKATTQQMEATKKQTEAIDDLKNVVGQMDNFIRNNQ